MFKEVCLGVNLTRGGLVMVNLLFVVKLISIPMAVSKGISRENDSLKREDSP
jgi:hypothetical protein